MKGTALYLVKGGCDRITCSSLHTILCFVFHLFIHNGPKLKPVSLYVNPQRVGACQRIANNTT